MNSERLVKIGLLILAYLFIGKIFEDVVNYYVESAWIKGLLGVAFGLLVIIIGARLSR
jgi:hypothetical protein